MNSVKVFAPATVANVASGFDILGFAVQAVGDTVVASLSPTPGLEITIQPQAPGSQSIPSDPKLNTAGVPALRMMADFGAKLAQGKGIHLQIQKGIPLGSGMGGSAASAVGAVIAVDALLGLGLKRDQLLDYALLGEAVASGAKHSDNIAPCLYGGLTLSRPGDHPEVIRLPYPNSIYCTLVHPAFALKTSVARAALKREISLHDHSQQSSRLGALIAGLCTSNLQWISSGLEDTLIEPQRAPLIPGFADVKKAALTSGALGCSISGAGPSVFALFDDQSKAQSAKTAMIDAFNKAGLTAQGWLTPILATGATLV